MKHKCETQKLTMTTDLQVLDLGKAHQRIMFTRVLPIMWDSGVPVHQNCKNRSENDIKTL